MTRAHPEDDLQRAVAQLLDMLGWLWNHCPNGEAREHRIRVDKRSGRKVRYCPAGQRLQEMGVKKGWPDVEIREAWLTRDSGGFGVAFDLKIKPNGPTPEQNAVLADLMAHGYYTAICYNLDDVMLAIGCVRPLNGRRI